MDDKERRLKKLITECEDTFRSVDEKLLSIISNDQFLEDLVRKPEQGQPTVSDLPTNEDVQNALELHYGKAISLTLLRGDGVRLPIVVPTGARVLELRWAVQRAIISYLKRISVPYNSKKQNDIPDCQTYETNSEKVIQPLTVSPEFISWRSVWKTKCLATINPHGPLPPESWPSIIMRLDDLEGKLQDHYNIRNGAMITFIPRLKRK